MPDQQITGTLTGTFTVTLAGSGGPVLPLPPQPKADRYTVTGVELYRNASDGTWTIDGSRLTFTPDPLAPDPPPKPPPSPPTTIPPAESFVDDLGATWTMPGGMIPLRDGLAVGSDAGGGLAWDDRYRVIATAGDGSKWQYSQGAWVKATADDAAAG
jgi:hypothetical protein